ncbi:MAG: FMN-binding protein [Nocardioidaceae bacterium]
MKRITFWFLSTLSVVVLLFGYDGSTVATTTATPPAVVSSGGTSSSGSTGSSGSTTSSGAKQSPPQPTAKTSTVAGSVASTQWGPVQVQLTVKAGKITKVSVVQYPSGNGKDAEINSYALPILTQETTSAQSASIDMVSGATVTSTGYIQSLQSAIDRANL